MFETVAASFTAERQDSRLKDDGDVEAALQAPMACCEAEYNVPYLAHAPLEPMNAVVLAQGRAARHLDGHADPAFVVAAAAR